MASGSRWSDGAAASWWDGAGRDTGAGGCVLEATEDPSAASAWWRAAHSQDHGSAQQTQSGVILLALSVSHVAAAAASQLSAEHLCLTKERVEEEREGVLAANSTVLQAQAAHEEHEATRLSAEDVLPEAAASMTTALDRSQAVESSRWRAVEASMKSAEALHKAQRESHELLDNLLESVKDFLTSRSRASPCTKTSLCWARMGGFATSARRWKGSAQGSLNDSPDTASSARRWPHRSGATRRESPVQFNPVTGAAQLSRTGPDEQILVRDASLWVS